MQSNKSSLEASTESAGQSKIANKSRPLPSDNVKRFLMKSRLHPAKSAKFGPVKVVIIQRGKFYVSLILVTISLIVAQLSIGAVNFMVLGYTLKTGDKHAILCTVGWHFFIMESVMSIVYGKAWMNLLYRHRVIAHYILNICGIICACIGAALPLTSGIPTESHGVIGFIAIIFTCVTAVIGPFLLFYKSSKTIVWIIVLHTTLALSSIILSSVCLILGLLYNVFKEYCGDGIAIVLIVLVSLYTMFIFILTIPKLCTRITYYLKDK